MDHFVIRVPSLKATEQVGESTVTKPWEMYVLNWGASGGMGAPLEQRPGHISLFEVDFEVYRLLDPNKRSNMTRATIAGGAIVPMRRAPGSAQFCAGK